MTAGGVTLRKRSEFTATVFGTAAVFAWVPYASAAPDQIHPQPVFTHVKTEAAFDFVAGDMRENITVKPDRLLTILTLGKQPKLVRITPSRHLLTLVVGAPRRVRH
ncbi:hypothetical protein [Streptomyces sp. NPDC058086]|uniref:hypothetical protein n=1 Tax=Streptomyces sp. NPDC058086 TaxID=3346334 RepID=UPI0036EE144D